MLINETSGGIREREKMWQKEKNTRRKKFHKNVVVVSDELIESLIIEIHNSRAQCECYEQ